MKQFAAKESRARAPVGPLPARPNRAAAPGLWPGTLQRQAAPKDPKVLLKDPCFGERTDAAKSRCTFSDRQRSFVRIVKEHALRKCARAIAAIGMPGNESTIKRIAKEYFHLDIKMSEKTRRTLVRKIQAVSEKLEKAPIECGTCQDEGCNSGFVAYAFGRDLLVLCPPFFMSEIYPVPSTPRILIHEACHLAGINKPTRDELYCHMGTPTKEDKCPVVDAFHNADAWSFFIDESSYTV